jgi:hypothetical protein
MSSITYDLTKLTEYRAYFEQIKDEAVFLNFFAYTKDQFDKASSDANRGGWCLILEPYSASITDNGADSVIARKQGLFVIAKKKTDELNQHVIEGIAENYAYKVLGRMRRDRREKKLETTFENFDLTAINPMTTSEYYGVAVTFDYYHPVNKDMMFLEADWDLL